MRGGRLKLVSRSLRQNQTDAEKLLWSRLRSRRLLGIKFRRQLPIGSFIVDFCSLDKKLVIELDGGQHQKNHEKDDARTVFLGKEGFRVIRIWNNATLANLDTVLEYIRQRIQNSPSPKPSPLKGEGANHETKS